MQNHWKGCLYHSVKLNPALSLPSACRLARATCICWMGPLLHTHPPSTLLCGSSHLLRVSACLLLIELTRITRNGPSDGCCQERRWYPPLTAHAQGFGGRKKTLPPPSVGLASPQKTKCARHPSVVMMSVLLCFVLSVMLPRLPVLHLQACLSA